MIVVGIDPGKTGAIALLDGRAVVSVDDMPEDSHALAYALEQLPTRATYVIEKVNAKPRGGVKMGAQSMYNFGFGCGVIEGVLAAQHRVFRYVTPQTWKRRAGLIGEPKESSLMLARELHPEARAWLTRRKDHGRAEAILIAEFGA